MWLVQRLVQTLETTAGDVSFKGHENCAGVLMVYKTKKEALKRAAGTEVIEITLSDNQTTE